MTNKSDKLFNDAYFENRLFNDKHRLASFELEKNFLIQNNIKLDGRICDVGCSTGEFLEHVGWIGDRFGMEVNSAAIEIAKSHAIQFSKSILTEKNYFDVVLFRGTIQHVDDPFNYISSALTSLRDGGALIFLHTPNLESFYYRLFNDLPALEKSKSFFLPGKKHLSDLCIRSGFKLENSSNPYIGSGYEKPARDFTLFFLRLITGSSQFGGPFPGNMMNLIFRKEL